MKTNDLSINTATLTRQDVMIKLGFTAFSAATMIFLLNEPVKGFDDGDSPDNPPIW